MDVQFDLFKDDLHELYEVVRTVHVDTNFQSYRIEVLRDCYGKNHSYKVRSWRREDLESGQPARAVWVKYDLPWVSAEDAIGALHQGLSFLRERVRK